VKEDRLARFLGIARDAIESSLHRYAFFIAYHVKVTEVSSGYTGLAAVPQAAI
jgi:hypothetical protein